MQNAHEEAKDSPQRSPAPPATPAPVEVSIPRHVTPARWGALMLTAGYSHGSNAWDALLVGANVSLWPRSWLWLQLGLSGVRTRTVELDVGNLHARGLNAELTVGGCPLNDRRLFACGGVRAGIDRVAFRASSDSSMAEARNRVRSERTCRACWHWA